MLLTVSECYWLSLVSMELLHVSHFVTWLLAVSYCPSGPTELLHVSDCCWLSLAVLPVPLSCCMSLTVSSSSMELLHVTHCLL